LEELFASFNSITQLFPLSQCDFLAVLDLEGNEISERLELQYLAFASKLKELNLMNNPIHRSMTRSELIKELPLIRTLDDESVVSVPARNLSSRPTALPTPEISRRGDEEEAKIVYDKLKRNQTVRPSTASARCSTSSGSRPEFSVPTKAASSRKFSTVDVIRQRKLDRQAEDADPPVSAASPGGVRRSTAPVVASKRSSSGSKNQ
jgi:hypothetical protein